MSAASVQLQLVSNILDNLPDKDVMVTLGVWDDLIRLIRNALEPIIASIKASVSDTVDSVKAAVSGFIDRSVTSISNVVTTTKTIIISTLRDTVNSVKQDIIDFITGITEDIGDILNKIGEWIRGAIADVRDALATFAAAIRDTANSIGESIRQALRGIRDWIADAVENVVIAASVWISEALDATRDWFEQTLSSIKAWIKQQYEAVREWVVGAYQTVEKAITAVVEQLKTTYEQARTTVEELIQKVIDWLISVRDAVSKFIWDLLTRIGSWMANTGLPAWSKAVDWAQKVTGLSEVDWEKIKAGDFSTLGEGIGNIFTYAGQAAAESPLFALATAVAYFWLEVSLQFVPAQTAAQMQAQIAQQLTPLENSLALSAYWRGLFSDSEYYQNAYVAGLARNRADVAIEAGRPLPTPGEVQAAFLRGEIDLQSHNELLAGYGFSAENIRLITSLYVLIPPPTDLIRMAVREAFTPEIAEKFGQYEDYPAAFTEWATKQGITQEWAERYWAAHWDLPSPQMGFEMLHRGVIDDNELKLLLRALDVMPYWRERLIQISYNPYTRVDVRRMYKAGVLDEAAVLRAYLDLGYNEDHARHLTEFTTRYYTPEDASEADEYKSLARTTYSQAYKRKIISADEYREFLLGLHIHPDDVNLLIAIDDYAIQGNERLFDISDYRKDFLKIVLAAYDRGLLNQVDTLQTLADLGYSQDEATLEINLIEYNRQMKLRDILVDKLHEQYVDFIIDNVQLHVILDAFNFESREIDRLAEEWEIERSFRTKRPPVSDLRKFLSAGALNRKEFLDELRGQGYHEKYIEMYDKILPVT